MKARVRGVVDDPRIKPRPTLHYRLPNCEINEPGWGVTADAWSTGCRWSTWRGTPSGWSEVCRRYLEHLDRPLGRLTEDWADLVQPWLIDLDDR
jgi:hypothetical protein